MCSSRANAGKLAGGFGGFWWLERVFSRLCAARGPTQVSYSCGHKLTVQNQTASIAWVLWRRRGSVLGACGVLFGHTLNQSIGADASTFATRKTRSLGARLQIYRAGWSHFHTLAHAPTRRHLTEPVRGSRQLFHSGLQATASLASLSLYVVLGNSK